MLPNSLYGEHYYSLKKDLTSIVEHLLRFLHNLCRRTLDFGAFFAETLVTYANS
jgi:hypothetical protein